jgi:DNA-binding transcriptional MerR regulator
VDDDLLPIGRFARLTGLTVGALRHYDEEGVLTPADVDPATGYRRYRRDQLQTARAVAALRDLELSLPAIRALLEADEPAARQAVLADEKRRLEARTARLQRALHRLSMLANASTERATQPAEAAEAASPTSHPAHHHEVPVVPTPPTPPTLDPAIHRQLGAGLYNRTWDLMEVEDRTADQDDEMVDTAHASAWHWRQVGNEANASRAHWILSRVYAVLGRGQEALYHARRQNEIIELGGEGFEPWDAPSGAEAMARALAIAGDKAGAAEWKARASQLVTAIPGAEDRAVIEGDIATIPV